MPLRLFVFLSARNFVWNTFDTFFFFFYLDKGKDGVTFAKCRRKNTATFYNQRMLLNGEDDQQVKKELSTFPYVEKVYES